jgi:two-component system NarL family sensor kinase
MNHRTVIRCLFFLFLFTYFSFPVSSQTLDNPEDFNKAFIDSLESTYSSLKGQERIDKIVSDADKLGYFYPKEIVYLIDKTVQEVRDSGNQRAEIDLLFEKNYIISDALSDLEGSRILSYEMLNELPVTKEEQAGLLDFIARTHLAKSELLEAERLYQRALKLLEEMEDKHTPAHVNVYWGIAVTYSESKNFEKSSEYFLKCLNEAKHQKKPFMISFCHQNLASNAGEMNDMKAFRSHLDASKRTIPEIPNESNRVISEMSLYNAYGDFYRKSGELVSAVGSFNKAIELSEVYDDFFTKSYAMHSLGAVYLEMNQLDAAEKLLLESHDLFQEKTPSLLLKNSYCLYELYKKKGEHSEALKWHETYTTLNDSIQKADNIQIIANATAKYEDVLKDQTIDLLEKEKLIEKQSKESYKNRWQIVIVLLLLLIVLGAFYLNHNRHQKRKKKIIHQVLGEERERERISMELHDGICSQISTISRGVRNTNDIDETAWRNNLANRLDHLNLEVRDISHNLALLKYDQSTPFQHILEDYLGDLRETVPMEFNLNSSLESEAIVLEPNRELVLFRVIQEICNNAIKYSESETVDLTLSLTGSNLHLSIQDHGIGFDPSSKGNGIRNIFERIDFLEGKVRLNANDTGTSFDISIPLKTTEIDRK